MSDRDDSSIGLRAGQKRFLSSSTSEESDSSFVADISCKQEKKRPNITLEEDPSNMALQEALDRINKRLDTLATREDVQKIKDEMKSFTDNAMKKLEELEGRVFEVEARSDKFQTEIAAVKKKNEDLNNRVKQQDRTAKQNESAINDLQQYSRRWNLRVYRVPEAEGEKDDACTKKLCRIFSEDVGIPTTPTDIEVAHRAGKRSSEKPRPILVRFFDRKKRDAILGNRRKLKNKGAVVDEDLTWANYRLSTAAYKHSATLSVWSTNGKVLAKLKNGLIVKLNIHMNLDVAFHRGMTSNVVSEEEEH